MQNVPDFKKFTEKARQKFEDMTQWEDFDYSYENAMAVFKEEIGMDIDENTDIPVKQYISPGKENTIKKISLLSWELRDAKIVETIINRLEEYNRIFIVYGASHAVVQEPALKALMRYYDKHEDK
jgi:hypothetical protein